MSNTPEADPPKIYFKDLQKAAYLFAVANGSSVYVWVKRMDRGEARTFPPYCSAFEFTTVNTPPDGRSISWQRPSDWVVWKWIPLEKAEAWLRKRQLKDAGTK